MRDAADDSPCDTSDGNMTKADIGQKSHARFLAAYREVGPVIARAARLAGVHRCTVYRWQERDPSFVAAMKAATEAFFAAHREKVLAQEAERQRWRDARVQQRKLARAEYPE